MGLPEDWFESVKNNYPKRQGSQGWYGQPFRKMIEKRISEGATFEEMIKGAKAYKVHCDYTGITGSSFVMQAQRFFGPSCYFMELDSYEIPTTSYTHRKPETVSEDQLAEDRRKGEENLKRLKTMRLVK